jgi:hypothetical protein
MSTSSAAAVVCVGVTRAAQREVQRRLRSVDELIGLAWAASDRAEALTEGAEQRAESARAPFADTGGSEMAQLSLNWDDQYARVSLALSKSALRKFAAPSSSDARTNAEERTQALVEALEQTAMASSAAAEEAARLGAELASERQRAAAAEEEAARLRQAVGQVLQWV